MKGLITIIGTNDITKHLQDQIFKDCVLRSGGIIHLLFLNGKKYFLDIKDSNFYDDFVLIHGIISDDYEFVGNIALQFYPEKTS
jgi:hypothetical protein